ncbi:esterase [Tistrella bauzanensis]|uniref:Esterase n=1 Tax=Tistrella bauzanensis TaxID=657419 RepID=A0ABQ1IJQ2_9PROT|nr:serine hydrolase domain-containing protein [Tistrella bauzanensis]GGB44702.1 esterase [Tistrella bauzanensis]
MASDPTIHGTTDGAFQHLRDIFRHNLTSRGELGAAVAVYHRGRKVVDLWGGSRNRRTGEPWQQDTLVPVYSTGKGLAAIACAVAVSRGHLALDAPIADIWPGFARHGKDTITLRCVLDHKAGLVLFGRTVTRQDLADPGGMAAILEEMVPLWRPGSRWGYHIGSFGSLLAELIRRTDPAGRSFGQFFADEVARPLGIDVHFGLPDDLPQDRLARISRPSAAGLRSGLLHAPFALQCQVYNPVSLLHRAIREMPDLNVNDRDWMRHDFPSANCAATARGIAAVYGSLATGGEALGIDPALLAQMSSPPARPPGGPADRLFGIDLLWKLGFMRPGASFRFSPTPGAFGMAGLGGSFGFCDPEHGIGYAYVPNRLGVLPFADHREQALRKAVYDAIATA